MRIFFDLDDTLIHSIRAKNTNSKQRKYVRFDDNIPYGSIVRESAYDLIEFARTIDPEAAIITTADSEWASTWNEIFDLGFTTIYDRDHFTEIESPDNPYGHCSVAWNGETLGLKDAVIIDNYPWSFPSPEHKMKFVFGEVDRNRWIQINEFNGHCSKDYNFADMIHIEYIKERITALNKLLTD